MAYSISNKCIKCGACAASCPTQAISEGTFSYEVSSAKCIDCGTCKSVCPVGAPDKA